MCGLVPLHPAPPVEVPPKPERPNLQRLNSSMYIVWTQAGFRKALKAFAPERNPSDVRGWPKSYPAFVALSDGYEGYHFTRAVCVPLDGFAAALNAAVDGPQQQPVARLKRTVSKSGQDGGKDLALQTVQILEAADALGSGEWDLVPVLAKG